MAEDMIERVARRIANEMHAGGDFGMTGDDAYNRRSAEFLALGRAAIKAMREPTEAMLKAGFRVNKWANPKPCHDHCIGRVTLAVDKPWEAMIDAALTPADKE